MTNNINARLRILTFLFCFLLLTGKSHAQEFGVSGSVFGYAPHYYKPIVLAEQIGHTGNFTPGMAMEFTCYRPERNVGILFAFAGIGVNYFLPVHDSILANAELLNGNSINFRAGIKLQEEGMYFRQSFEIHQEFNELLTISFGYSLGWFFSKAVIRLPDESPSFPYTSMDINSASISPIKNNQFNIQGRLGVSYEFEKLQVEGYYTFMFDGNLLPGSTYRQGLGAGIFYPLIKIQ
ncbi:hypothetical protein BH09BAC5_BH09BAC5_24960 [soil metagenome]